MVTSLNTLKPPTTPPGTAALVRQQVQALLAASPGYQALPRARQAELTKSLQRVATYMADPQGLVSQSFRQPLQHGAVDLPGFVQSLIKGVFGSIVNASIEQMDAYAALVAQVASTVDQFMKDKITDDAARQSLAEAYPDVFGWSDGKPPRLRLRPAAKALTLMRLAQSWQLLEPVIDAKRPGEMARLVAVAKWRMARQRQEALAKMLTWPRRGR